MNEESAKILAGSFNYLLFAFLASIVLAALFIGTDQALTKRKWCNDPIRINSSINWPYIKVYANEHVLTGSQATMNTSEIIKCTGLFI